MIVMIKTHGRPDRQLTYETLRKAGYGDKIVFVTDDEDKTRFNLPYDSNTDLLVFDKKEVMKCTDSGVSFPKRNVNLYSWVACEYIAKDRFDEECFIMADDDITGFRYRYEEDGHLKSLSVTKNLRLVFDAIFDWMEEGNIAASCTGMPQMYFSKDPSKTLDKWRVVYTFVFRLSRFNFDWMSEYEEDIISSINNSKSGNYITACPYIQRDTIEIGSNESGMKSMYDENKDRFRLSEYGYIWNPSCRKIIRYKDKWMCSIKRDNAFQKLLSSCCKKD